MKITVSNVETLPEIIEITRAEYVELKSKAKRYDQRKALASLRIKKLNNSRSTEERKAFARKAAQARWSCNK